MAKDNKRWVPVDHVCRSCYGRILQCVAGGGPTGGGNPLWMCANCEVCTAAQGPDALCACGFKPQGRYMCVHQADTTRAVTRAHKAVVGWIDREEGV